MPSSLRSRRAAALVAALLLAASHAASAAKRSITETDLFKFVWTADPQISPDGRQVVYVRVTVNEKKDGEERGSDGRVITHATYRFNGGGYEDVAHPGHIWAVTVPAAGFTTPPEPRQLTSGEFQEGAAFWSPDSSLLYYGTRHDKEPYYSEPHVELYAVPAGGGESRRIFGFDGGLQETALSPDGRRIGGAGIANVNPDRSYNQPDLFVLDVAADPKPRNLTAKLDADPNEGLGSDQHPPRGGSPQP